MFSFAGSTTMASSGAASGSADKTSPADLEKNIQESLMTSLRLILEVRSSAHDVFNTFLDGGISPDLFGNRLSSGTGVKDGKDNKASSDTKYLSQIKLKLDNIDTKIK